MRALVLVALLFLLPGCGAAEEPRARAAGKTVSGHGLELTLPDGWYGDVTKLGPHHAATLRAATFPLAPLTDSGQTAQKTMGADDLLIVVADYGAVPGRESRPQTALPIRLGPEQVVNFEGFLIPVGMTGADVAGTSLQIWVVAAAAPTAAQLERANAVLATLRLERARWRAHADEAAGLSARIPPSWAVAGERLTPFLGDPKELLNVGTGAFKPGGDRCAHVPERTLAALGPEDALVTVLEFETPAGHRFPPRAPALLEAESWKPDSLDCLPDPPALDYRLIPFTDAGRSFYVYVAFGAQVTQARRRETEQLLASLSFERRSIEFSDAEVGLSGRYPAGWHRERALTGFVAPREVLALASYPLRRGAEAGECAPDTAREDMPRDGVFIWLLEYEGELPPERFPPRPSPFRLDRARLSDQVSCFAGPGWTTTFRAPRRQFQLLVSFGSDPSDERLRDVEWILDGLEFGETGAPFPDPYQGWPLLGGSAPDSMYAPPGWPAAAADFVPREDQPPRALFFASNRPLPLLPRHVERARLPSDFPDVVLAHGFPDDAVLVWALEESVRRPLAGEYPPIDRDWPAREDFRPVEIATKPAPHVRWLVASGQWMGHRFSVWIARGPEAAKTDVELALKAAGTLAVSGCDRGVGNPCVETR